MPHADLDQLTGQLLAQLSATFRLDLEIGGRTLDELLTDTIHSASRLPDPEWGTPGDRFALERAGAGPLSFTYRPHLFPGMDEALRLGHEVQFSLLPKSLPASSPCELAAVLESYCHLSGDLLGWHEEPGGGLTIWLLDVSGHGVRAGFAAVVMKLLLAEAEPGQPLDVLAADLERRFLGARNPKDAACLYATGIFVRIAAEGPIQYLSAGHEPMLIRRRTGRVDQLDSTGYPLALISGVPAEVRSVELERDDVALLVSDGLTEAADGDGPMFGSDRTAAVLGSGSPDPNRIARALYHEIGTHRDLTRLDDDLSFVVARRRNTNG